MTNAKLNMKKKDLEKKVEELEDKWKRAAADYQNLEKRFAKEKREFVQFTNAALILKLLPVLDSLEKAVRGNPDEGLDLVLGEFRKILQDEGVEEIEAEGKDFDPNLHECVEVVKGDQEGKVVEVLRKGYKIRERVIRPAQVKVAKAKAGN